MKVIMRETLRLNKLFIVLIFIASINYAQVELKSALHDFENGNYKQAAESLEIYYRSNPNDMVAFQYLINSYLQLNEFDKALPLIEKGVRENPGNQELKLILAKVYFNKQLFSESEKILLQLNNQKFNLFEVHDLLGKLYFNRALKEMQNKNYTKALFNLQESEKFGMKSAESFALKAQIYLFEMENDKAIEILNEGLSTYPGSEVLYRTKSILLIEAKEYNEAIEILQQVWTKNENDIDIGLQLAILYRTQNRIKEAFEIYEKLLAVYPKEYRIYDEMKKYFQLLDKQNELRQLLENMKTVFPEDKKIDFEIAETFVKEGSDSLAISKYEEMIDKNGLNVDLALNLADLYVKNNKIRKANTLLNKAVTENIIDRRIFINLGKNLEAIDDFEYAQFIYQKFMIAYPKDYTPFLKLGLMYFDKGNYKKAKEYFKNGLEITEASDLLFNLAEVLKEESEIDEAISAYQKAFLLSIDELDKKQQIVNKEISQVNSLEEINEGQSNLVTKEQLEGLKNIISESFDKIIQLGNTFDAQPMVAKVLKENPKSAILLYFQAEIYFRRAQLKDAEKYYLMSLNTNPAFEELHLKLAEMYSRLGLNSKAILSYKRVLGLNPESHDAYSALIKLAKINGTLSSLCDEWLNMFRVQKDNKILKEFLIEALHKAERISDAQKIINQN